MAADRVGLGWRPELAPEIHRNQEHIDALEIIADNWFRAGRRDRTMLRALAAQIPLLLHGVGMGLASSIPAEGARIDRMARLLDAVRPESWSEHLAFVRAGGVEIGHLTAPPRTGAVVDGTLVNIARAVRITGAMPALENIATLIEPPASLLDEPAWLARILDGAGAPMLLDLHNLYANAVNFGRDPFELLAAMPVQRVGTVHLSGGAWVRARGGARRLLDDHAHDVPPVVFRLLEALAARAPQPLTVIIERDGCYPSFATLLGQIVAARAALVAGRARCPVAPDALAA